MASTPLTRAHKTAPSIRRVGIKSMQIKLVGYIAFVYGWASRNMRALAKRSSTRSELGHRAESNLSHSVRRNRALHLRSVSIKVRGTGRLTSTRIYIYIHLTLILSLSFPPSSTSSLSLSSFFLQKKTKIETY